jgi:hypothetical protein
MLRKLNMTLRRVDDGCNSDTANKSRDTAFQYNPF